MDTTVPHRFVLLGIPLVVWFNQEAKTWHAFQDICPHRLVPLSEGRITSDGLLECGYHGWAFDTAGNCKVIPQGGTCNSRRAAAVAYRTAVRQGLVFVKPIPLTTAEAEQPVPQEELARIPIVDELEDPEWVALDTWRDLPMDWSTLMENVLDPSHVPFTHHISISDRYSIGAYDMEMVTKSTLQGFEGIWKTGPRGGKLGPQTTVYRPPVFMQSTVDGSAKGSQSLVAVYAVPSTPGRCRLINRNSFKFTKGLAPIGHVMRFVNKLFPWSTHMGSNIPLEDDQVFLHIGETEFLRRRAEGLTTAQACYMPSKADTFVIAFRNWLDRFGQGGPFGAISTRDIGLRQDREQLLDRFTQHTRGCASCMAGLLSVQRVRAVMVGLRNVACAAVLLAAAVALVGTPADAAAAATGGLQQGGAAKVLGEALLHIGRVVTGGLEGGPQAQMLAAALWGVAAIAAGAAAHALAGLEAKFYKGSYPLPRNQKPGPSMVPKS